MRVLYISKVFIPSGSAAAVQVQKMGKSLSKILGKRLLFLTNGDPKASEINNHVSMNTYGSTTLLDALIYTKFTVRKLIEHNPDLVITRDSYLALICALFRKTVILEVPPKL